MMFYKRAIPVMILLSGLVLGQGMAVAQTPEIQDRVLEWPDGTRYEGGVLNGQMEGRGVITWPDGTRFEGNFSNGMREGPGRLVFPNGDVLSGVFSENMLIPEDTPQQNQGVAVQSPTLRPVPAPTAPLTDPVELSETEETAETEEEMETEQSMASDTDLEMESEPVSDIAVIEATEMVADEPVQLPEDEEVQISEEQAIVDEPIEPAASSEQEIASPEEEPPQAVAIAPVNSPIPDSGQSVSAPRGEQQETSRSTEYSDELENEIVAVIDAWARAWSAQNPALYFSFYSSDFLLPEGMSRNAWERQRLSRINAPEFIQVDVGYSQFELLGNDVIEVYLRQGYTSDTYSDFTNKLIRLQKEQGLWKIIQEETL